MNKYQNILSVAVVCLSSSLVNAQCKDGVCRIPALNSAPGYTSSYSGTPTAFETGRSPFENSGSIDARRNQLSICRECGCDGQYCNCGPNCPSHYQSEMLSSINNSQTGRLLYRNDQPFYERDVIPGSLRAPNPASSRYQAASYTTSVPWMTNYEHGLAASRRSGRPMLVKISADWCDYCQQMKRQTYTDQGVVRTISNGFVPVTLDGDVDRKLIQQLGVRTLPAVVVIAPDLRILNRIEGFKTAQQLTTSLLRHRPRAQLDADGQVATR